MSPQNRKKLNILRKKLDALDNVVILKSFFYESSVEEKEGFTIATIFKEKGEDFSNNTNTDNQLNYAIRLLIG